MEDCQALSHLRHHPMESALRCYRVVGDLVRKELIAPVPASITLTIITTTTTTTLIVDHQSTAERIFSRTSYHLARDSRVAAGGDVTATLNGVNTRVTEFDVVQEQDTQDIYAVIEDTQDRQTCIFHIVEALVDDRQYHYETIRLLDQEALVSREAWAHSVGLSSAVHYELQGYKTHTWMQDHHIDA
ncbi:hypothetical protein Tco_0848706 [Tanacetum coccineum]